MKRPRIEWFLWQCSKGDRHPALLGLKLTWGEAQWGWSWELTREEEVAAEVLLPKLRSRAVRRAKSGPVDRKVDK